MHHDFGKFKAARFFEILVGQLISKELTQIQIGLQLSKITFLLV